MFKISRSILTTRYTKEALFERACKSIDDLITSWELQNPSKEIKNEELFLKIKADHFEGELRVIGQELHLMGHFHSLFQVHKKEAERLLNIWIQQVFSAHYES